MSPFAWAMFGLAALHLIALFVAAKMLGSDKTTTEEVSNEH